MSDYPWVSRETWKVEARALIVGYLASRAIPGVEVCVDGRYLRTGHGPEVVEPDVFGSGQDLEAAVGSLHEDPVVGPLVRARPDLPVPGCFDRFELGVRAILGQQVSVAGASTLAGRLVERHGEPFESGVEGLTHTFPSAEALAEADIPGIGMPQARADTIMGFSFAVASGAIDLDADWELDDLVAALCELKGIGPWTANYLAMRGFEMPDAFPLGDLGLRKAAGDLSAKELNEMAERWRPHRAHAAIHLWLGAH